MKKVFLLISAALTMTFMACTGNATQQQPETDSTEVATDAEEPEVVENAEPAPLVGPATFENEYFSLEIPEGWQVTKQSDTSCTVEAVEKPEEGSNFGWDMDVSVWASSVFKAEETIKDEQDVFEDSKSQPDQKFGGYTFLYTYMAYEFGDHSVLAAPLREDGGCIQVKIGGYKLENTPALQEILKSLKVKKTE